MGEFSPDQKRLCNSMIINAATKRFRVEQSYSSPCQPHTMGSQQQQLTNHWLAFVFRERFVNDVIVEICTPLHAWGEIGTQRLDNE
tara:strand:- start:38 stop:295 length:258 start_codon:yes stop_codon:yes gene_type:complete